MAPDSEAALPPPIIDSLLAGRRGLVLVLGLTALCFASTLGYGFSYDDFPVIVDNETLLAPGAAARAFTSNVWAFSPDLAEARYYRPLFTIWLIVNSHLFGVDPVGWHVTTIMLHGGAVAILWFLLRRLTGSTVGATIGAALFAVHPTRGESVAWVCGLTDPMAATVGLGAVLAAVSKRWVLATALFAAALLTKETAIVFCAFPLALAVGRGAPREGLLLTLLWGAIGVAFLLLRGAILGAPPEPLGAEGDLSTLAALLGGYTHHLLAPGTLTITPVVEPAWGWAIGGVGLWVAAAIGARGARGLVWMGGLFLLPVLIVKLLQPDMLLQDRYLYLPSACWFGALGWGAAVLHERRGGGLVPALGGVAVLLCVAGLTANLPAWKDDQALWAHAIEVNPNHSRATFNLGVDSENRGDLAAARNLYERAVELEPDRAIFHFRLAFMFAEDGQLPRAHRHFSRAADLRPTDPMMLYEAGRIEAHRGGLERAEELLIGALRAIDDGVVPAGGVTRAKIGAELRSVRVAMEQRGDGPPVFRWE